MKYDRIPINQAMIPYRFSIPLNDTVFVLEARYNAVGNFFTVGLFQADGTPLCTEALIYGETLFLDHYRAGIYPAADLVPLDDNGEETMVGTENFGKTVYLCVRRD